MRKLRRKTKVILIVAITFISLLAIAAGGTYYMAMKQLDKVKYTPLPEDEKELGIDEQVYTEENQGVKDDYINILLLGIDARHPEDFARCDTMIVATIDKKHKKLKLSSIMRDMVVTMEGRGTMEGLNTDRINQSYGYGGAPLTTKVINENFKTNVRDYIKVDFSGMEKVVDVIGGVEVEVKEAEIPVMNNYIRELSKLQNDSNPPLVTKAGKQLLNGRQTLGYCRIRYVGNRDFDRTLRQRNVLTEIFNKITKQDVTKMMEIISEILPYVETSLEKKEIISLAKEITLNGVNKVEQFRLPLEDNVIYIRNEYFLGWDRNKNLEVLHKFIYEEDYDEKVLN
ncbi:MAG: LCP family protein [Clostridiales bacterium]|uniref:LCP family protein n=1 Tax=Clostridium sp. N3C TaxID=1776758 RepID=UPI00092E0650|nr:LCP family protein [Clostridium sp. N3C]NLZ48459.1 LCP family protein [Clostridiales bacterium]SCN21466.1 Regulatory protein MsrR [Clostridium sp. N3C]